MATTDHTSTSIVVSEDWHIHYDYTSGPTTGRFLTSLVQKRIEGIKCPQCQVVWMPPRAYCERCYVATDEWTQVGPAGTIEAATVINVPFVGGDPVPYAIAFVLLDGADTALVGKIRMQIDPDDIPGAAAKLAPGTRVKAVFHEQRVGQMSDFHYELA